MRRTHLKTHNRNVNETQIEEVEEECDMVMISESRNKKINFEEELSKQEHLD